MSLVPLLHAMTASEPELDTERAYRTGNWETSRVLFRTRQWAVTTYGIENLCGPYHYHIPRSDLRLNMGGHGRTWADHMAEKNWVDASDFEETYQKALDIFSGRR